MAEALAMGHRKLLACKVETTYGTIPTFPAATDMFLILNAEFNLERNFILNEEANNTASYVNTVEGKRNGTFTIEAYLKSGGAAGVEPDAEDLYQSFFTTGSKGLANTLVDNTPVASTTAIIYITDSEAANVPAGTPLAVQSSGETKYQMAYIDTSAAGAAGQDDVAISPVLTSAPAAAGGGTVLYGTTYAFVANPTASFCAWYWPSANECLTSSGCVIEEITITTDPEGLQRVTFKGIFADQVWTGTGTCTGLNNTTSPVTFTHSDGNLVSVGSTLTCESEVDMLVTAVSGNSVTVTRPTAASHADSTAVVPTRLTPTINAGVPLSGSNGYLKINDTNFNCNLAGGTVTFKRNLALINKSFGCETNQGYMAGKIEVTFDFQIILKTTTLQEFVKFHDKAAREIFVQYGTAANNMCGIFMPTCEYNAATINSPALNDYALISITGRALSTSAGLLEAKLMFI